MIDTHTHLNFGAFDEDVGVTKFIVPGARLDSSERAFELSQQFGNVFAAVGFHPHHRIEFNEEVLKNAEKYYNNCQIYF